MIQRFVFGAPISVLAVVLFAAAYLSAGSDLSFSPIERMAAVSTTACGHASATTGGAILIGGGQVLTAAHVAIGASELSVTIDGADHPAILTHFDTRTDIALLLVDTDDASTDLAVPPVDFAEGRPNAMALVVSGGPSGIFDTTINRRVEIRIEQVRSTARDSRLGLEFDQRVALGDSGAGVFDDKGALIGMVFGRSSVHADRSFAVRSEEIERVLAEAPQQPTVYRCDPSQHRVVPVS